MAVTMIPELADRKTQIPARHHRLKASESEEKERTGKTQTQRGRVAGGCVACGLGVASVRPVPLPDPQIWTLESQSARLESFENSGRRRQ